MKRYIIVAVVTLLIVFLSPTYAQASETALVGMPLILDTINAMYSTEEAKNTLYDTLAHEAYTQEELNILYRITEAEVTNGTINSKVLVVHVILNRIASSGFPNTVKEVVFEEGQFAPVWKDKRYYSVEVTEETKIAVHQALCTRDKTSGALFFSNMDRPKSKSTLKFFESLEVTLEDPDSPHVFFRPKITE